MKYIEVAMPDEFADEDHLKAWVNANSGEIGKPQRVSRARLVRLANEFCRDIEAAFGMGTGGAWLDRIDEPALDWPDMVATYNKARNVLVDADLTAEELENLYAPDGGHINDEHPIYSVDMWKTDDTRRGYWDWVVVQIEEADHD